MSNLTKMACPKSSIARSRNAGRWKGKGSNWATPPELYEALNKEFGFTLDVCAEAWNAKHSNYIAEEQNSLLSDWKNNVCFMNPPYGKILVEWIKKAYESSLKGALVVCLVPSATDTAWWHEYAMKGEIRFLRNRPRFLTIEGKWQQTFTPSSIVIFRPNCESLTFPPKGDSDAAYFKG